LKEENADLQGLQLQNSELQQQLKEVEAHFQM